MLVDSLNLSTKFIKNELGDPINYKTYIHNADKTNSVSEIPIRYQDKKRMLKDRESINSFRIYDTNLKKRTNPSDIYQQEIKKKRRKKNKEKCLLLNLIFNPPGLYQTLKKHEKKTF